MRAAVSLSKNERITILWFAACAASTEVDRIAAVFEAMHVRPNTEYPAAAVAMALGNGPVLAVIEADGDAARILELGVDEVVRVEELETAVFTRALERTRAFLRIVNPLPDARAIECAS